MASGAAHLDLDPTYGALFIGVLFGATLFGISCVQVWFYFSRYTHDAWHLKCLVTTVFCMDMLHQILISHSMYIYVIKNFANPAYLMHIEWSLILEVAVSGVTAFLVQGFFIWRIYKLSERNLWYTGAVFLLSLSAFVITLIYSISAFRLPEPGFVHLGKLKTESQLINILGAVSDVAISCAMVKLLYDSRTGFKPSDGVINRMMIFAVNTGLVTCMCALSSLTAILASPNSFIFIGFFFNISRLYANSLFTSLNVRDSMRSRMMPPADLDNIPLSQRDGSAMPSTGFVVPTSSHHIEGITAARPELGGSGRGNKPTEISFTIGQTTSISASDEGVESDGQYKELSVKHPSQHL